MKVLVTGCVSKHANPRKNRRDVMVSWMLASCLRDLGHEVEHRDPTVDETYEEFDHVFLGLSAFHALGANRTYGVLAAFLRMGHEHTTFFIDDPELSKVMTGVRSFKKDPKRLFKPFYQKRLGYDIASKHQQWLLYAIDLLHDYAWPTTVLPLFPWGDVGAYRSKLPNVTNLVALDLSSYVPEYVGEDEWSPERQRVWITEAKQSNRWLNRQETVYPVRRYGNGQDRRPIDPLLCEAYTKVWGVLDPGLSNGFFNSRIVYAAQSGALYITNWRDVEELGSSYKLLPDVAAGFSEDERTDWVMKQLTALRDASWDRYKTMDAVSSLLKTKVNA